MKRINTKSVRFRTTAGAAIALAALLALAGLSINFAVSRQVQRSFDANLLEQATDRAGLLNGGAASDAVLTTTGDEAIAVVVRSDGSIAASSGTTTPEDVVDLPLGVSDHTTILIEHGDELEREELRVAVAAAADGSRVVVGNEGDTAKATKATVRNVLLGVIPLTAAAGSAVAWYVTGRALTPVKRMRLDLDDVVHASDGRRVTEPGTGDEIDELGATINGVLDRLDSQSTARRQFVADASHELKSPVANALAIVETAESEPDPAEYDRVTSAVSIELHRMHALVDDLLYLARDDELARRVPSAFDLADIAFDEAERVAARSSKKIDASGVMPVSVLAVSSEVARALRNLLENAERFATERVTVSTEISNGMVTLTVADDGVGIPQAQRAFVFERFTRLETDRARSAGGTGLGLSIVASIAERNDGSIAVCDSPSGGAQFELSLPAN